MQTKLGHENDGDLLTRASLVFISSSFHFGSQHLVLWLIDGWLSGGSAASLCKQFCKQQIDLKVALDAWIIKFRAL